MEQTSPLVDKVDSDIAEPALSSLGFLTPGGSSNIPLVEAAGYTSQLAQGGLAAFFVSKSTGCSADAQSLPLPTTLCGYRILVEGIEAPLVAVRDRQINCQVPFAARVGFVGFEVVKDGQRFDYQDQNVYPDAVTVFTADASGKGLIVAVDSQNYLPMIEPGKFAVIYATGLGEVDGFRSSGAAGVASAQSKPNFRVELGGRTLTAAYAGKAPGLAGVDQINLLIPADVPVGSHAIKLCVGQYCSQTGAVLQLGAASSCGATTVAGACDGNTAVYCDNGSVRRDSCGNDTCNRDDNGNARCGSCGMTPGESETFALINAERSKAGKPVFRCNPKLTTIARSHSADMCANDFFSHINLTGKDAFARMIAAGWRSLRNFWGENIAMQTKTPRDPNFGGQHASIVANWMTSTGHRANILRDGFDLTGIGVATCSDARSTRVYWTQLFSDNN